MGGEIIHIYIKVYKDESFIQFYWQRYFTCIIKSFKKGKSDFYCRHLDCLFAIIINSDGVYMFCDWLYCAVLGWAQHASLKGSLVVTDCCLIAPDCLGRISHDCCLLLKDFHNNQYFIIWDYYVIDIVLLQRLLNLMKRRRTNRTCFKRKGGGCSRIKNLLYGFKKVD